MVVRYEWSRTQGYEVSSLGDKRFSALFATLPDGKTIEGWYQGVVKGYDPYANNWRAGKGKPPLRKITREQQYMEYKCLWYSYFRFYPEYIEELKFNILPHFDYTLRDSFATSDINQARAIADILNRE